MDDSAQEILEFIVKLKAQEMERGIALMEQRLAAFDQKAKLGFDKVSASLNRVGKRNEARHQSLTVSLTGGESLLQKLSPSASAFMFFCSRAYLKTSLQSSAGPSSSY